MRYDWRNNSVLFIHNFDAKPHEIAFEAGGEGEHGDVLVNLLGTEHSKVAEDGKHHLVIEGYGLSLVPCGWARLICCGARTSDDANACALSARDACRRSDECVAPRRGVIVSKTTVALQSPRSAVTIAAWPLAARRYEILAASAETRARTLPCRDGHADRRASAYRSREQAVICSPIGEPSQSTWRSPISRSCQGATRRLWLRQLGPDLIRASGASNRR